MSDVTGHRLAFIRATDKAAAEVVIVTEEGELIIAPLDGPALSNLLAEAAILARSWQHAQSRK